MLPVDRAIYSNNIGFSGGLWFLWDSNQVEVSELSHIEQEIHVLVSINSIAQNWLLSAVYSSPRYAKRRLLWENLGQMASLHSLPWVIARDFNEILMGDDKLGGRLVNVNRAIRFQECLDKCKMIDIRFSRPRYTWSNLRPLTSLIQERIVRAFINAEWNALYPKAAVKHLERVHSDHYPIMLSLHHDARLRITWTFRF